MIHKIKQSFVSKKNRVKGNLAITDYQHLMLLTRSLLGLVIWCTHTGFMVNGFVWLLLQGLMQQSVGLGSKSQFSSGSKIIFLRHSCRSKFISTSHSLLKWELKVEACEDKQWDSVCWWWSNWCCKTNVVKQAWLKLVVHFELGFVRLISNNFPILILNWSTTTTTSVSMWVHLRIECDLVLKENFAFCYEKMLCIIMLWKMLCTFYLLWEMLSGLLFWEIVLVRCICSNCHYH